MNVGNLLAMIDMGSVALPVFQRGYVWNREQVRGLMDSLYKGHPVGSLLTWQTQTETAETRGNLEAGPGPVNLLLDGQQRITTLYGVIRGEAPPFFEGSAQAFTGLYFHLDDEVFQFYAPVKMQYDPRWISVTRLMREGLEPFIGTFSSNPDTAPQLASYMTKLNRIAAIQNVDLHAEVVAGEDKTVDTVVDIFNRVNSGGTKLSKGDLALAKVCAGWPAARDELNGKLRKWKRAGFHFKLDWLLRCVTCLLTGNALFSTLEHVSTSEFKSGLIRTEKHVDYLLNLISSRLGLDHDRVLGSPYSFPVMVRYLDKRGGALTDPREVDHLLFWYIHTYLWGRFSGATESVVNQDLEAIRETDGGLDRLIGNLRQVRGDLRIAPADFSGSSIGARFYPLLYMLTRVNHAKDWCTNIELSQYMLGNSTNLELHHIFPKSLLYRPNFQYRRREVNALANFTFLTQACNAQVSNHNPAEYIPHYERLNPGVVQSHWVPMDASLWTLDRYLDFLGERQRLLAQAANEFLDSLYAGTVPYREPASAVTDTVQEQADLLASHSEDDILLDASIWVEEQGLPEGEFGFEIVDKATGQLLATLDVAWPDGLQQGLSQPVALLIDEDAEVEAIASQHGFSCYTDAESLKKYVMTQILAVEEPVGG